MIRSIEKLLFGPRRTKTVREWLAEPGNPFTAVMLAERIGTGCARELVRVAFDLSVADPDNDSEWDRIVDEYDQAEATFLDIHGKTEVTL